MQVLRTCKDWLTFLQMKIFLNFHPNIIPKYNSLILYSIRIEILNPKWKLKLQMLWCFAMTKTRVLYFRWCLEWGLFDGNNHRAANSLTPKNYFKTSNLPRSHLMTEPREVLGMGSRYWPRRPPVPRHLKRAQLPNVLWVRWYDRY